MKKYLILLLVILLTAIMLFMLVSCREAVLSAEEKNISEGLTNLTNIPAPDNGDPAWSPDGKKFAFQSNRDGNFEIYVMNTDGTGQVNLSNNPGSYDSDPAWSPDGKMIAFQSNRNGNGEIYIMLSLIHI